MTTVITNPAASSDSGNGTGLMVSVLLVVVIAVLFFIFGLPAMQNTGNGQNTINPAPAVQVPQVTIPNKIDVNVQPVK